MRKYLLRVATGALMFLSGLSAYKLLPKSQEPRQLIAEVAISSPQSKSKRPECEILNDFVDADRLTYGDFEIVRRHKTIQLDWYPTGKPLRVEVSFAELRRGKKTLASFDGVYHAWGNLTDFGMFRC